MKLNQDTVIVGSKTVLVPYRKQHVAKYHSWMQNAELRELTASEPLSLDEEYEMQQTWLNDEDKCTFIILDKQIYDSTCCDEIESMVGDVNLFLNDTESRLSAESEIMIAEVTSRGHGLGQEALLSMMQYGVNSIGLVQFTAKIGYANERSRTLFEKLGFVEVSRSDVFQESTLRLDVDEAFRERLGKTNCHLLTVERNVRTRLD